MGAANGACMRAYMAIYGSSPIGRAGRKGTVGNPFPSLDQGRELPRAYPFPSLPLPPGKGREGKVIPTLFRSVNFPNIEIIFNNIYLESRLAEFLKDIFNIDFILFLDIVIN